MRCLGIETSCDETSVAVWDGSALVCDDVLTQIPVHSVFGGVVPELASREHLRHLDSVVHALTSTHAVDLEALDLIAVTRGPGLLGALLVGISYAKSLALSLGIPIVGVNHLHAHLVACEFGQKIEYPALGVLVSGGHTHLYYMPNPCVFLLIGKTLDDAAGEAFDKIAKLLNLPYPGGKYIDFLARRGNAFAYALPRPYLQNENFDFSFSGLKTAVARCIAENAIEPASYEDVDGTDISSRTADLCAVVNRVVAETLVEKTRRALRAHPSVRTLCVAGGVAANSLLRTQFADFALKQGLKFLVPDQKYCGDNGAMVAYAGVQLASHGYTSPLDFEAIPRGRPVPNDYIVNPFSRSE